MQDALLIRRYVRQQSQVAFAEIVSRYRRLVYFTCLREAGDAQVAEDAAQSVFLILAQKAPALRGKVSLAGWLFQTARLTAKDALKRERRRQKSEREAALTAEQEARMPQEKTLSGGVLNEGEVLNETLAVLKEAEREAVLLRFFDDMSFREIGMALNITEDTAQKRVARALAKMRAQLVRQGLSLTVTALAGLLQTEGSRIRPLPPLGAHPSSLSPSGDFAAPLSQQIAQGVLQTMWITKAGWTAGILCLGFAAAGLRVTALKTSADPPAGTTTERAMTAADWANSPVIQEVRITGNHTVSTADILSHIQTKPGDALNLHMLQSGAISPVFKECGFDLVGPYEISAVQNRATTAQANVGLLLPATPAAASTVERSKVIVTIPVTERLMTIPPGTALYFEEVRITGNYQVPTVDILKHVAIKPGDVADGQRRAKLDQAITAIRAMNEFDAVGPYTVVQSSNRVIITIPVVEKPTAQ